MKLMFWKKKASAEEEMDDAPIGQAANTPPRESLDFNLEQTETAKPAADQPEPDTDEPALHSAEEEEPEAPPESGLVARIRMRLSAMVSRYRKPPPFRAEEHDKSEESEEAEADEPDSEKDAEQESPETDVAAKPSLSVRIKLGIIAFVRRFRKPSHTYEEGDEGESEGRTEDDEETAEPEAPPKPGFFKRLKAAWGAFVREFKALPETTTDEDDEGRPHDRADSALEGELPEGELGAEPVRPRKWLVIGGSVVIAILLLTDLILFNWHLFEEKPKRWGTKHNITSISSRPNRLEFDTGGSQPGTFPELDAEIEALRQKNAELQARIEAQKRQSPSQQHYVSPDALGGGGPAAEAAASGEIVVDSKDPKATAMSLKEAIEAMNASTGDYQKKPAK